MQLHKYLGIALLTAALSLPLSARSEEVKKKFYKLPDWCIEPINIMPYYNSGAGVNEVTLTCKTENGGVGIRRYRIIQGVNPFEDNLIPAKDFILEKGLSTQ